MPLYLGLGVRNAAIPGICNIDKVSRTSLLSQFLLNGKTHTYTQTFIYMRVYTYVEIFAELP